MSDPKPLWEKTSHDLAKIVRSGFESGMNHDHAEAALDELVGRARGLVTNHGDVGRVSAPTCSSHLWGVSCGHTSCPLHGPWETKWAGKGASAERDEDFQRMVLGVVRAAPREPSPEAIAAAEKAWAHGPLVAHSPITSILRAAYAVDGVGGERAAEPEERGNG